MIETKSIQNVFLDQEESNFCILDDVESEELFKKLKGDISLDIKQRRDLLMTTEYVWDKYK